MKAGSARVVSAMFPGNGQVVEGIPPAGGCSRSCNSGNVLVQAVIFNELVSVAVRQGSREAETAHANTHTHTDALDAR